MRTVVVAGLAVVVAVVVICRSLAVAEDVRDAHPRGAAAESAEPRVPLPSRETGGAIIVGPPGGEDSGESLQREYLDLVAEEAERMSEEDLRYAIESLKLRRIAAQIGRAHV